ncbi:MAG: DUF4870 domain-containing protein [Phycisphaerae bacterium]|nr:DUF4870 domain-containing protein [Phycisphaerae bacterium]
MDSPQPPEPPPVSYASGPPPPNKEQRAWGMACHLLALVGFLGPLIMWLIKKDEHPFVDDQGKEALNFQISVLIYAVGCGFLVIVLIGLLLLPALGIFNLVMIIIATVRANDGEYYRYPLCIRFIK